MYIFNTNDLFCLCLAALIGVKWSNFWPIDIQSYGIPTNNTCVAYWIGAFISLYWTSDHCRYGGGPAVNNLVKCGACETTLHNIKLRQQEEQQEFGLCREKPYNNLYALSTSWYQKWECFIKVRFCIIGNQAYQVGYVSHNVIVAWNS